MFVDTLITTLSVLAHRFRFAYTLKKTLLLPDC